VSLVNESFLLLRAIQTCNDHCARSLPNVIAGSYHLGDKIPIKYGSAMADAASFVAPALLVAYLAVGGLLLLVSDARKQRHTRRQAL
jgi:hypothetical protein